jgi:non-specific serine/threonine protein kinase
MWWIGQERSPEREELTQARMAERAAEWGLVLKSDMLTGRICGVRTRKSLGEYEYLAGDRSSGDRTSSGTSSTFPGTSTRTSMRKSRTSMRMSGTSMRTALGEALEDDKGSNTSSFYLPTISLELKDALSSFEQSFVVSDATTPEFPIMYASGGFFSMTGYSSQEVMGQNWQVAIFPYIFVCLPHSPHCTISTVTEEFATQSNNLVEFQKT